MSLQEEYAVGPNIRHSLEEAQATADWLNGERIEGMKKRAEAEDLSQSNWDHMAYKEAMENHPVPILVRQVTPWVVWEPIDP